MQLQSITKTTEKRRLLILGGGGGERERERESERERQSFRVSVLERLSQLGNVG